MKIMIHGIAAGAGTGLSLGLFLKGIEAWTGSKVYTLLLNVDFVPFLPQPMPEWIEFALHTVVSIAIAYAYAAAVLRFPAVRRRALLTGIAAGILALPSFFPLALLSERTPAVHDLTALGWWTIGHLLYGLLLGLYGRYIIGR